MVERDRGLDLRDEVWAGPALGEAGTYRLDVFGVAHEREPDEVGLDAHRHLERRLVGVGEGLHVTLGAGHVHALARSQDPGVHHPARDVVAVDAFDAEHDRAVGEVDLVADARPRRELRDGRRHVVLVADDRLRGEREHRVGVQLDLVAGDRAGTELGAREVDQHADGRVERGCGGPRRPRPAVRARRVCRGRR